MNQPITHSTGITPAGQTPYSAWIQTDVLHTLQNPVSHHPGEHAWITSVQVSELYWMLIIKEIRTAQAQLRKNDITQACDTLERVVAHHEPLNATWKSIAWMTPADLLSILSRAVAKYGQDTALQGWTYRQMVYLLGIKQPEHLQHFIPQPARWKQLNDTLAEPSLYDDILAFLHRAGFPIPDMTERDYRAPYIPMQAVENAWREIYADPDRYRDLRRLGETLADIAEGFSTWKHLHLMATRRTFGHRAAYFGTEGIAWLLPTLQELPFPELWAARSTMGEPPMVCPHMSRQPKGQAA
ncbi:tryptophan 2,3-dioxygenase [Bordetella muralis]|uniref:tryptophan 2,3-dioxygenase n=1 Tax=Bordetella muralis TaxID=1649130 RepID=UPI0039EFA210